MEQNFAEPVNPDKAIYKGAIPGMLRTLDPHSNFFDPRDYRLLREDQKGHYYGVGMQVGPRNGKTVVIAPFPGTPAYRAGTAPRRRDRAVDGKPTDNLSHHAKWPIMLRGPQGTRCTVVVRARARTKPPISPWCAMRSPQQRRWTCISWSARHRLHARSRIRARPPSGSAGRV